VTGKKGVGRCTGGGRRGGGKQEKKEIKYPTLHNISQSKKCKEAGANKYRAPQYIAYGIKGYGKREV